MGESPRRDTQDRDCTPSVTDVFKHHGQQQQALHRLFFEGGGIRSAASQNCDPIGPTAVDLISQRVTPGVRIDRAGGVGERRGNRDVPASSVG